MNGSSKWRIIAKTELIKELLLTNICCAFHLQGIKVQILGKVTLDAPRDHINLHVRGGYVLPAQVPALNTMLRWVSSTAPINRLLTNNQISCSTVHVSRNNSFQLLVALDDQHSASGQLFWDDGESWDTVQQGLYQINTYKLQNVRFFLLLEVLKVNLLLWK